MLYSGRAMINGRRRAVTEDNRDWPEDVTVSQVRIARPTHRFDEIIRFYTEGLGLALLDSFESHAGYDGVSIGLPDRALHLEIVQLEGGGPYPVPSPDDLLVLYLPNAADVEKLAARMRSKGYGSAEPLNPYWRDKAVVFHDPDGWGVVLCNTPGI